MSAPRFSLVIPTRERATTLACALQTCLTQEFEDFEIVVCDNCSSPATKEVVDRFADPRLRYVRAPKALAMSVNWELAVSHARGEYLLVLGDDDGLLPHALRELDRLIRLLGAQVIRWSAVFYTWPTIAVAGEANYLRVPLGREVRRLEARSVIASVIRFETPYVMLPMLYNAAIHRSLVDELRRRAGRVFGNRYPDVYSGFALGYTAGTYWSVELPMSVAGSSGGSYGVAAVFFRGKSPLDLELRRLDAEAGLPVHPWVSDLPLFPVVPVADSFQLAKETFFRDDATLNLDRKLVATLSVEGLRADSESEWRAGLATIRATFAEDPALSSWFDATFESVRPRSGPAVRLRSERLGYDGTFLHLDAGAFGVSDVCEAVDLCEKLLNCRGQAVEYVLS